MNHILRRAVAAFNRRDARRRLRIDPTYTTGPLRHRRPALPSRFAPADHREAVARITARGAILAEPITGYLDEGLAAELSDGDRVSPLRAVMTVHAPSSQAGLASLRTCRADDLPYDVEAAEVADAAERIANGEAAA
jgi:hypothetical protein